MVSLKTFGQSMAPFFLDGDVLMLTKVPFSSLRVNDLVTFKKSGQFISHRIIYISPKHAQRRSFLITQGDNNPKNDGKVYPKAIIGRVDKVKRGRHTSDPKNLYLIQSTVFFDELVKMNNKFVQSGVDFVYVKGLPIWLHLAKTHPKRFYADCDILVSQKDIHKADRMLAKLGYRKLSTTLSKGHDFFRKRKIHHVFYKDVSPCRVYIDVHVAAIFFMPQLGSITQFYDQTRIDTVTRDFLQHKKMVAILGKNFPILQNEDLLIATAFYLFHHSLYGYFRYEKLRMMLGRKDIDFQALAQKIMLYKLENFIYPVFLLLQKYYATPIPSFFLKSIKPDKRNLTFIGKNILTKDIFASTSRITEGIDRFKTFFILSPNPLYQKMFVLLNPAVLYSLFWVLEKGLKRQQYFLSR